MGKFVIRILVGVFVILLIIVLGSTVFEAIYSFPSQMKYGVTFSPRYASYLKLDWQKTYNSILDLNVKNLRIPTFWDILQPQLEEYDFSETDYMVSEADKKGARVILVLGGRQPRWPECHIPAWAKVLSVEERHKKLLEFIAKTVERYKNNPSVWAWQVENEPLLKSFGEECDIPDKDFLKKEVDLVRSLSNKTIIMTDSGELGFWVTSMRFSDVFGTTVYRKVYDKFFGYTTYPLPPYFYNIKSSLIRNIFAHNNRNTIIVELQAEPWLANGTFISPDQQTKLFTLEDFRNYINFAGKTGFDEAYLWGVEWWYFMSKNGHPEYLEYVKSLFK